MAAAGVLVAVIGVCECARLVRLAYVCWLMNRQQSNESASSEESSSSSSSSVATIEQCWLHCNYTDNDLGLLTAAAAAAVSADSDDYDDIDGGADCKPLRRPRLVAATKSRRKYTLLELTDLLQREPMEDEIVEFVDVRMVDGVMQVDGVKSAEKIGGQLIREAGLVFSCSSLSPVTPGTCFNVTGTTNNNCERFSVNLQLGGQRKDIALHINPRLPQNYIVRNCRVDGQWGTEEVTSPLPFRLKRGAPFAVQVLVTESDYYIALDGRHFAAFRHRLPYGKIQSLQVHGDVNDVQVDQLSILQYPEQLGGGSGGGGGKDGNGSVLERATMCAIADRRTMLAQRVAFFGGEQKELLEMPFYGHLGGSLAVGQTIHIFGTVKLLPHSFYVNLQTGRHIWPHPTIAFHLNPRFAGVGASNVICRNSWHNGQWDREERSEIYTDFMPSRKFHMEIRCDANKFVVYVNEKCITEYVYKVAVGTVDTVHVQGDIRLTDVLLERE